MPPLSGEGQDEVEALLNAEHHERDHQQLQVLLHPLDPRLPAGRSLQLRVSTFYKKRTLRMEAKETLQHETTYNNVISTGCPKKGCC